MPSLQALEQFKASVNNLGGEPRIQKELNLPPDDLPLPDHEPAAPRDPSPVQGSVSGFDEQVNMDEPPEEPYDPDSAGSEILDFGELSDLVGVTPDARVEDFSSAFDSETEDEAGGSEDLLGDFLDSIPDNFGTAEEDGESANFPESPDSGEDMSGLPPGLLDGFAGEIEAERASSGDEDFEFPPEEKDVPGLDSPDLGDMDFGESFPEQGAEDDAFPNLNPDDAIPEEGDAGSGVSDKFPDFDSGESMELFGEESSPAGDSGEIRAGEGAFPDIGLEELPGFDSDAEEDGLPDLDGFPGFDSGESPGFSEGGAPEESDGEPGFTDEFSGEDASLDLGEFPNFDSGESLELSEEEGAAENDGFNPEEGREFEAEAVLEELPGDAFDNFRFDSDAAAEDFNLDGDDFGGGDEFNLTDIDGIFDGQSGERTTASRTKSGGGGKNQDAGPGVEADEIEEIRLSETELEQFRKTLASYPLNLRIACEELIAEQAVAPDLMSRLVRFLITGASATETAALAGKILGKSIPVPKGFEKKTGEALEIEQSSFAYIFVHNFLPVFGLFMGIALVLFSAGFLCWKFIYTPIQAEKIYQLGIERIIDGEYTRANDRFNEAFLIHEKKSWFYTYAREFREARQYTLAEEKYRQLLYYTASKDKRAIPEKEAVLEYADMETRYIGNHEAADTIIRRNILDYFPLDREALLALGDNSLAWGEYEPARLEEARESYARHMERYGRTDPLLERMLKYFIRTDNLEEALSLQSYFMTSENRQISPGSLAELGGYLLDKRFEEVRGVPNAYLDSIGGIREVLLRAVRRDSRLPDETTLPETYYQLARYYNYYENFADERTSLERAVESFERAAEGTPKRLRYHINTLRRYGEVLANNREFIPAEETLLKGVKVYESAFARRLLSGEPEFGRLYADLGDLEYFAKEGEMGDALGYYVRAEENGWAPPEMQYRMGAAHYQRREWGPALDRIFAAFRETQPNRRVLYALGNVSYMRGNYFAAQGYYGRLLEILEDDRSRLPPVTFTEDENQLELAERLMVAQNNFAVTLEALTNLSGDNRHLSLAHGLYSDSARAWDILTRNPVSMIRMRASPETSAPGVNPAYLNIQNSLNPVSGYNPMFFLRIDKDILEPSRWEELAPPGYRLSEGVNTGR